MKTLKSVFLTILLAQVMQVTGQKIDSVKSDGVTIYFEVFGNGEPIYFLSGGPGLTPYYILDMVKKYSEKFQVVLIHQRGTGKSVVSINEQTILIDKYLQDIKAVKDKLAHKKISILGHSWGGMLAMHYSKTYPDDVEKLILVGPGGYNTDFLKYFGSNINSRLSDEDKYILQKLDSLIARLSEGEPDDQIKKMIHGLNTEYANIVVKGYIFDKKNAAKLQLKEEERTSHVSDLMWTSLGNSKWDIKNELARVNSKTLIIQGRQDPVDLETAMKTRSAIKNSELYIVEECGHFPWIEQPELFYKAVDEFLTRN